MDRGFITAAVGFFSGRCHELLLWSLPWASFLIAAVGFFFCSRSHAFFLAPPEFFFSGRRRGSFYVVFYALSFLCRFLRWELICNIHTKRGSIVASVVALDDIP
jgi:hypothetical protein